jgi:hypothetical protein
MTSSPNPSQENHTKKPAECDRVRAKGFLQYLLSLLRKVVEDMSTELRTNAGDRLDWSTF